VKFVLSERKCGLSESCKSDHCNARVLCTKGCSLVLILVPFHLDDGINCPPMLKVAWVGNIYRHTGDVGKTKRGDVTSDSMRVDTARSPSKEFMFQSLARFLKRS
jgi:hypothetical protein